MNAHGSRGLGTEARGEGKERGLAPVNEAANPSQEVCLDAAATLGGWGGQREGQKWGNRAPKEASIGVTSLEPHVLQAEVGGGPPHAACVVPAVARVDPGPLTPAPGPTIPGVRPWPAFPSNSKITRGLGSPP